jgi:hypothetical protein
VLVRQLDLHRGILRAAQEAVERARKILSEAKEPAKRLVLQVVEQRTRHDRVHLFHLVAEHAVLFGCVADVQDDVVDGLVVELTEVFRQGQLPLAAYCTGALERYVAFVAEVQLEYASIVLCGAGGDRDAARAC